MRYLALDLEVHRRTEEIRALAGVYADGETFVRKSLRPGALAGALAVLDDFAERADIVLGHNLINFDLQHLRAAAPGLRLLSLPALDTLMLSPLAFPKNPYHRLVKHYQDGDLVRERRNDPEYDSRLALTLFADERKALAGAAPDLLLAWHWLTSAAADQAAFDAFFGALRQARRPSEEDARAAIDRLLRGKACATRGREVAVDAAPRIAGPRMRVNELPVVSADAQRPFGTRAVVRLRRVPERTGVARRWLDARRHRGADDGGQPRPRPAPDRQRQVAVLPGARPVALPQDGRTDGRHLALGHRQRHVVHAGTGGRPGSHPARRWGDCPAFAGATSQSRAIEG